MFQMVKQNDRLEADSFVYFIIIVFIIFIEISMEIPIHGKRSKIIIFQIPSNSLKYKMLINKLFVIIK